MYHNRTFRIAVISDTHNLLRPEVAEIIETCDAVLHAGDISNPETLEKIRNLCGEITKHNAGQKNASSAHCISDNFYVVRGNNDRDWASEIPYTLEFRLFGCKFFMTHKKKDIPSNPDADVVIFGHSHRYAQEYKDGVLYLNPGSCGPRRFTQPITMAVLTIQLPADATPQALADAFREAAPKAAADTARKVTQQATQAITVATEPQVSPAITVALEPQSSPSITVAKIEIPHKANPIHKSINTGTSPAVSVSKKEQVSADIIRRIGLDLRKRKTVADIAARNNISEELAEQIVRLYVTHPGVTPEQIMSKMGL